MVSGCTGDSITWSLSIIITDLVRLPKVASISRWSSLASAIIRLMGADSELITATTFCDDITLPNPIFTSFNVKTPSHELFNVLNLFSNLFKFRFHIYHGLSYGNILSLRTSSINFTVHLLN